MFEPGLSSMLMAGPSARMVARAPKIIGSRKTVHAGGFAPSHFVYACIRQLLRGALAEWQRQIINNANPGRTGCLMVGVANHDKTGCLMVGVANHDKTGCARQYRP